MKTFDTIKDAEDFLRAQLNKEKMRGAYIESNGEYGMAMLIGDNLSSSWMSGDIIVFWGDGEQTVMPTEFKIYSFHLVNELQ